MPLRFVVRRLYAPARGGLRPRELREEKGGRHGPLGGRPYSHRCRRHPSRPAAAAGHFSLPLVHFHQMGYYGLSTVKERERLRVPETRRDLCLSSFSLTVFPSFSLLV